MIDNIESLAKKVRDLTLDYAAMHFEAKGGRMVNSAYVVEHLSGLKDLPLDVSALATTTSTEQGRDVLCKLRRLCDGGKFDLTDSPKSFVSAVTELLGGTSTEPAKEPAASVEGLEAEAQILALAGECGIDVDTDGDIWGSTNGSLMKFARAIIARIGTSSAPSAKQEPKPRTATREQLYTAVIDCGHSIDKDKIVLYRDTSKEGNALSQLGDRLDAIAAPSASASPADNQLTLDAVQAALGDSYDPERGLARSVLVLKRAFDAEAKLGETYKQLAFAAPAAPGMHAAADYIDAKAQKYLDENASTEHDTGAVVFHYGDDGREYHSNLVELAEELRAAAPAVPVPAEQHPDDLAVDRFAAAMKAKLAKKRTDGRGGWETPKCTDKFLADLLMGHTRKGDPVDVANLAMMLHQRNVGHLDIAVLALRIASLEFAKRTAPMFSDEAAPSLTAALAAAAPAVPVPAEPKLTEQAVREVVGDMYLRMRKSYAAEPVRRITFMDMEAVHEHVKRLGLGGCLDAAEAGATAPVPAEPPKLQDEQPIECWSANEEDFNSMSLDELLECNEELKPGSVVWVGEAVPPKPAQIYSASDVVDHMADRAYDIAGELADNYPEIGPAETDELQALIDGWILKHAPPNFYTVRNIKPRTLTADDFPAEVEAAPSLQQPKEGSQP